MTNAIKGLLWSALVFPGLGQLVLKLYKRAALFIAVAVSCIGIIVVRAVNNALAVLDEVKIVDGTIDMNSVTQAAQQAVSGADNSLYNFLLVLLLVCWVVAALEAFLAGKRLDRLAGR